jgi:hypothetical protein
MRFADLFLLAVSSHAGPILINFDVTPIVLHGRRACRADLTAGSGGTQTCERSWMINPVASMMPAVEIFAHLTIRNILYERKVKVA